MTRKYKIFTLLFAFTFVVSGLGGITYAQSFSDIQGHWAETRIDTWASKGLVKGYPDGTFQPDHPITRAEFVTMVNHAFVADKKEATSNYNDVEKSKWYYHEVAIAKQQGYISGYPDGSFRPNAYISRQEVASILSKLFQIPNKDLKEISYKDKDQFPDWSYVAIQKVSTYHLMNGYPDGTFGPFRNITRAESVTCLDNAFYLATGHTPSQTTSPLPLPLPIPIPLPNPLPIPLPNPLPIGTDQGTSGLGQTINQAGSTVIDKVGDILNNTLGNPTSNPVSDPTGSIDNIVNNVKSTVDNAGSKLETTLNQILPINPMRIEKTQ
jgi:hypothetical protein